MPPSRFRFSLEAYRLLPQPTDIEQGCARAPFLNTNPPFTPQMPQPSRFQKQQRPNPLWQHRIS